MSVPLRMVVVRKSASTFQDPTNVNVVRVTQYKLTTRVLVGILLSFITYSVRVTQYKLTIRVLVGLLLSLICKCSKGYTVQADNSCTGGFITILHL